MTPKNIAQHRLDPNIAFWKNLKEGSDHFEALRDRSRRSRCAASATCSVPRSTIACRRSIRRWPQKSREDEQEVASLVERGVAPIKLVYDDGGQHESFRTALGGRSRDGDSLVLAARCAAQPRRREPSRGPRRMGPQEIVLDASGRPKDGPAVTPSTALAFAATRPAAGTRSGAGGEPAPVAAARRRRHRRSTAGAVTLASCARLLPPAPASDDKPFYKRVMSSFTSLIGSDETSPRRRRRSRRVPRPSFRLGGPPQPQGAGTPRPGQPDGLRPAELKALASCIRKKPASAGFFARSEEKRRARRRTAAAPPLPASALPRRDRTTAGGRAIRTGSLSLPLRAGGRARRRPRMTRCSCVMM